MKEGGPRFGRMSFGLDPSCFLIGTAPVAPQGSQHLVARGQDLAGGVEVALHMGERLEAHRGLEEALRLGQGLELLAGRGGVLGATVAADAALGVAPLGGEQARAVVVQIPTLPSGPLLIGQGYRLTMRKTFSSMARLRERVSARATAEGG